MNDAVMAIAAIEAESAANSNGGDIASRLSAAMEATVEHWLLTDENGRFRAAMAGTMASFGVGSPEHERLSKEVRALTQLSAMLVAAQADLVVEPPEAEEGFEPVGAMKLWNEVKAARKVR